MSVPSSVPKLFILATFGSQIVDFCDFGAQIKYFCDFGAGIFDSGDFGAEIVRFCDFGAEIVDLTNFRCPNRRFVGLSVPKSSIWATFGAQIVHLGAIA